ncbi:uncharacterized protein N7498_006091 [Penicillium cinerascens]|uniref:DUF7514 domain-containing protein n=1 Tax=Penicillium cinerascens TaxID=70096 RepID=A0A9W9MHJ1_9EURO|nr:uncharacterized protein N7498_006091 [Penicillium cinerascens]KAJ5201428.1 hypothetical protein N7498_006091 [Penicillium cinerascens]
MSSASTHWGTLINPDKSPAPLLEQLCLGIAQLLPSFDSNGTTDLTPDRLATFYRRVGGNYDTLFLATKTQSLSFIYQSLGCFHSLQPSTNPYESPSIPSLLPNGFVRWQTIQLLMDPDEHARFLQEAVKQWDIVDAQGQVFPKEIPRDAFPSEPDPEMMQWHEGVCRRLEYDFVKRNVHHVSPPNFGAYNCHFKGKDPLPDEEDYFAQSPPVDAITTGGSARSIPRPALADMIQGLSRVRMTVDQVCRPREGHHHLALQSVHVVHEAETDDPGMVALSAPQKWMTRQIMSTYRIIHCTRKTSTSDRSTNRAITNCHRLPTPAPDAILTTPMSVNPHETFHHHRKSSMKTTIDAHQDPSSHPLTSVEKAALVPGQQASNSETLSSTAQHQLQPQNHRNTQRLPHHRHEVHPALDTT